MKIKPLVTVFMPVYNCEKYVGEAIESILNQTFKDFILLIINDGSTDDSEKIIQKYLLKDTRIWYEKNDRNLGLVKTLNKGLDMIQTTYVARMDADDISLLNRLKKQIDFMEKMKHIDICGTFARYFGKAKGNLVFPENNDEIKIGLLFGSTLAHPTVIMRKKSLDTYKFRYRNINHAEDYDLWVQGVSKLNYANVNMSLLKYRVHDTAVSVVFQEEQSEKNSGIQACLLKKMGVNQDLSNELLSLNKSRYSRKFEDIINIKKLFEVILSEGKSQTFIQVNIVEKKLKKEFFFICFYASQHGLKTWAAWRQSKLIMSLEVNRLKIIEFWLRCLFKIKK